MREHSLTTVIYWMGFAGKYNLYRPPAIIQEFFQPVYVMENQVRPFIGSKTTSESNREGSWVKQCTTSYDIDWIHMVFYPQPACLFSYEINQFYLHPVMGLP